MCSSRNGPKLGECSEMNAAVDYPEKVSHFGETHSGELVSTTSWQLGGRHMNAGLHENLFKMQRTARICAGSSLCESQTVTAR